MSGGRFWDVQVGGNSTLSSRSMRSCSLHKNSWHLVSTSEIDLMAFSARLDMMVVVSDISSAVDASIASLIRSRLVAKGVALSRHIATALIPFISWLTVLTRPFARYKRAIVRVGVDSSSPCMIYS